MKRLWSSLLVLFLTGDAVLLLLLGRRWVRFTRFGPPGGAYFQLMTWFLQWPPWLLRLLGVAEGALAYTLFTRWYRPQQGE
jgi:hypothetical protein